MKRTIVLVSTGATILALSAGVVGAQVTAQKVLFCEEQNPGTSRCVGTAAADSIFGQETRDVIVAREGNDVVEGNDGDDEIQGDDGGDQLRGEDGDDKLSGNRGPDQLDDSSGFFGPGGPEPSVEDTDELNGNRGRDFLNAVDGDFNDSLNCGAGDEDTALFDVNDETNESDSVDNSCENLVPVSPRDFGPPGPKMPPEEGPAPA